MNGYSKINPSGNTPKSRSIDFPDFFSFIETPKLTRNASKITRTEEPNQIEKDKAEKSSPGGAEEDDDGEAVGEHPDGEIFGVVLGRSASVSSSATGLQGTMKRAFSMRRSSSVSERYCRIHDQYVALGPSIGEDGEGESNGGRRSVTKKKKKQTGGGGKILRACKRLLGF
ncbi:uncharacterized protein LOC129286844 [Prosopis cineraria]|uniref:uncharacterized protein LOC129286844 n=1 Tax=Prosopis cineraria TaxID=364024 RepID=UPI00240EEBFD|nr:uncharacterized protein LOC129286844 [Prosopis cineraria]